MSEQQLNEDDRPTAFISYAQASENWKEEVLRFCVGLRSNGGVAAEIDAFHDADHQEWTNFGVDQIASSDFTIIAVDRAYKRRWTNTESPGKGAGATREAAAIKALHDRDPKKFVKRVKIVLLPGATEEDIPDDLFGRCERFAITEYSQEGLEKLLRSLWERPALIKPPLGPPPSLPSRAIEAVDGIERRDATSNKGAPSASASDVDREDEATLRRRLASLDERLRSLPADAANDSPAVPVGRHWHQLQSERATVMLLLEALGQVDAERASGVAWTDNTKATTEDPVVAALYDISSDVRYEAISALQDRLTPELLPEVRRLLDDSDEFVKRVAIACYGKLAPRQDVEPLVTLLHDPNSDVRYEAISALQDRLTPELLPEVRRLLDDSDEFVRRQAVIAWEKLP